MDEKIRRGRGRPTLDTSRKNIHAVRLDDEEEAMLRHMEIELDMNISDITRKAIRMFYNFKFGRL